MIAAPFDDAYDLLENGEKEEGREGKPGGLED